MAKNIERAGDHVTNIAELVSFRTTGHGFDEARPKGSASLYADGERVMSMAAQAPSRRDAQTGSIKPRVLIVEDETALVELLRYNLEQSGFRVSVAYDGEEALASVQEDVPDLILLDWMLPLMSGIEVCRQLRRQTIDRQPADHHADGARRGGRSRARARCRRRRLRLQAVLADRAGGAHPRRAAPHPAGAGRRGA